MEKGDNELEITALGCGRLEESLDRRHETLDGIRSLGGISLSVCG